MEDVTVYVARDDDEFGVWVYGLEPMYRDETYYPNENSSDGEDFELHVDDDSFEYTFLTRVLGRDIEKGECIKLTIDGARTETVAHHGASVEPIHVSLG